MSDYPILVERYSGDEALLIVCEACGARETITADDIQNDGLFACPVECGKGYATYMYAEADHRCPNCGKLGYFDAMAPYCSRLCSLQGEHAIAVAADRIAEGGIT